MADQKISAMPSASTLTGAELVPLVQSGANVQTTVSSLINSGRVYGAWSDSTSQSGNLTAGVPMTFNSTDVADGITVVSGSRLTVPNTGVYNLQFSAQLRNVDNAQNLATIWIRVNGVDVPKTATQVTVPARKSASIYGYGVAAWNFFLSMTANDYVQLYWVPESTAVTIESLPASVGTPAYPAIPSIIATMNQVG